MRHGRFLRALTAAAGGLVLLVPGAQGAIVFEPGANKVTTPRLEIDFGNSGGNVERIDSLRWRDSALAFRPDLASNGGADCGDVASAWGFGVSRNPDPGPRRRRVVGVVGRARPADDRDQLDSTQRVHE